MPHYDAYNSFKLKKSIEKKQRAKKKTLFSKESVFFDNFIVDDGDNFEIVIEINYNDAYVLYEDEKKFADIVSDRREVISGGGHLNAETGYTKFNDLIKYL